MFCKISFMGCVLYSTTKICILWSSKFLFCIFKPKSASQREEFCISTGKGWHPWCCATLTWKMKCLFKVMWVELWWCGSLVTWFCYAVIVKPGNKTATPPWSDQCHIYIASVQWWQKVQIYFMFFKMCFFPAVVIIAEDKSIQDKLAYYDLQAQTFSEVAPIQVYPARVLSHIFAHLGKRQCLISSVFTIEIPQSCAKLLVHLNPVYDALSISTLECSDTFLLTHWGPVTPFGDIDLGQHWLR